MGFIDIGPGFFYVRKVERFLVDAGFFAEEFLDGGNHGGEGARVVAAAEVDDFVVLAVGGWR